MIPSGAAFFQQDFELEKQPTRTYKMHPQMSQIQGYADGLEAMKQVIEKIIFTERYQYVMYSWNYGIELNDLYGEPVSYVCPELERRITEALLCDERIQSVENFEFNLPKKGVVQVSFTVHTTFGEVQAQREVDF